MLFCDLYNAFVVNHNGSSDNIVLNTAAVIYLKLSNVYNSIIIDVAYFLHTGCWLYLFKSVQCNEHVDK